MACCARGADLGEKCDDCRTWEEELYWKRFQPLHFCQILGSAVEFHKQLIIPRKFADNARAIIPSKVTLRGPSGVSWYATMTTKGNDMLISDGWEDFVKAYSLQTTNILFFKYDGVSVFDVLIFDGDNLCEKESSYFVKKCGLTNTSTERQRKRLSSEVNVEENGDVHIEKATKQAREEVGKNTEDETKRAREEVGKDAEDESPRRFRNTKSRARSNAKREKLVQRKAATPEASPAKASAGKKIPAKASPAKKVPAKASTGKKVPATSSENLTDSFAILAELGKSIVENATSILEPENTTEINGGPATETPNQNDAPLFDGGFSSEAPEQDTTPINGDWMIESPPQDTTQIHESFLTEVTPLSRKEVNGKKKATLNIASLTGKRKKGVSSSGKKKASTSNSNVGLQSENSAKKVTSVDGLDMQIGSTEGADDIPFGSPESSNRKFVSEAGKFALEMARKELTDGSFAVVMRPTSVYRRFLLTVPPAYHKKHLAPKSQDVFLRIGDKTWLTRLSYSSVKATGQICGGWKQFVQENHLEEYDVCLFSLASQNEDSAMMDVSIFRGGAGPTEAVPLRQVMADDPLIHVVD